MTRAPWRYAFASVAGTSHRREETPCQDASDCRVLLGGDGTPVLVAVVADGAGSASRADEGSRLACALFAESVETLCRGEGVPRDVTRGFAERWLERFQSEIAVRAEAEGLPPRAYACTTLAAVVGPESAAFLQIGDGAIIVTVPDEPEEFRWVFWPQKGEYENMTHFATDDTAREHLEYCFVERRIDEVAMLTDGLQRLALHFESQCAHAPFFQPVFAPVRAEMEGFSETLSSALAAFLDLEPVNARTDDDKTLVLATRRLASVCEPAGLVTTS